ncbi:MAG: glycosyltransferase family 61 protein, partial [Treponema sp.]|nr:glycosyltransferase family 61 protein [Treponema sp.]
HNLALSGKRARGVAGLVARALDVPDSLVTVTAHGDDWEGLVDLAQGEYSSDFGSGIGSEIRSILSRTADPAERKAALSRLDGYRRLLAEVYPVLRRTEVTIIYF